MNNNMSVTISVVCALAIGLYVGLAIGSNSRSDIQVEASVKAAKEIGALKYRQGLLDGANEAAKITLNSLNTNVAVQRIADYSLQIPIFEKTN